MKKRTIFGTVLIFMLVSILMIAAAPLQEASIDGLVGEALGFLGLGALALIPAALVNVLKAVGLVKEGQSKTWVTVTGVAVLAIAYAFNLLSPNLFVEYTPAILAGGELVMTAAGVALQIIVILKGANWGHDNILRGLPLIGKTT